MITAIDTNVLIDVLTGNPEFGPKSLRAVRECKGEGKLVSCEAVWAEVASGYASIDTAGKSLTALEISYAPVNLEAALVAGQAQREYRQRGGPRTRVASDFLIGAHAFTQADRLLTRDRGFYRSYFRDLEVLDPTNS